MSENKCPQCNEPVDNVIHFCQGRPYEIKPPRTPAPPPRHACCNVGGDEPHRDNCPVMQAPAPPEDVVEGVVRIHPEHGWMAIPRGDGGNFLLDCGRRDANERLATAARLINAAHAAAIASLRREVDGWRRDGFTREYVDALTKRAEAAEKRIQAAVEAVPLCGSDCGAWMGGKCDCGNVRVLDALRNSPVPESGKGEGNV